MKIVTCSECKNYKRPIESDEIGYCYIDGRAEMKPNDYCSWAEEIINDTKRT